MNANPHLMKTYAAKKWDLSGLQGISDATLEMHFGLYEGYVKNTNLLNEKLDGLRSAGEAAGANPSYAELVRRLGSQGLGVMLISHNLHDVFETADRITVLRLGRNVGVFERRNTTQQAVVEAITAGE